MFITFIYSHIYLSTHSSNMDFHPTNRSFEGTRENGDSIATSSYKILGQLIAGSVFPSIKC